MNKRNLSIYIVVLLVVIVSLVSVVPIITRTHNGKPVYSYTQMGEGYISNAKEWILNVSGREYEGTANTLWCAGETEEVIGFVDADKGIQSINTLKYDPNQYFLCLKQDWGCTYVWNNLYCATDISVPQLDEQTVSRIEAYYGDNDTNRFLLEKEEMKPGPVTTDKMVIKEFTSLVNGEKNEADTSLPNKSIYLVGQVYCVSDEYPMLTYVSRILVDEEGLYYADVRADGDRYVQIPKAVGDKLFGGGVLQG